MKNLGLLDDKPNIYGESIKELLNDMLRDEPYSLIEYLEKKKEKDEK